MKIETVFGGTITFMPSMKHGYGPHGIRPATSKSGQQVVLVIPDRKDRDLAQRLTHGQQKFLIIDQLGDGMEQLFSKDPNSDVIIHEGAGWKKVLQNLLPRKGTFGR